MMWLETHTALRSGRRQISSALRSGRIAALAAACLAAGCDGAGDEARRECFKALELSKTGQPLEE